ncbi:hypothetical protein BXZ70DRAFT_728666 [Cristinia sonorae]|uniref:Uncharacterized protein n=1 Tax=Cristinia sonorae TaxID=1940300 RepID=A0A8K0XSD8_9AGAR|nr:hypothetical protein BXZ70DRAFT_728666 [Cristinia sonorae]
MMGRSQSTCRIQIPNYLALSGFFSLNIGLASHVYKIEHDPSIIALLSSFPHNLTEMAVTVITKTRPVRKSEKPKDIYPVPENFYALVRATRRRKTGKKAAPKKTVSKAVKLKLLMKRKATAILSPNLNRKTPTATASTVTDTPTASGTHSQTQDATPPANTEDEYSDAAHEGYGSDDDDMEDLTSTSTFSLVPVFHWPEADAHSEA